MSRIGVAIVATILAATAAAGAYAQDSDTKPVLWPKCAEFPKILGCWEEISNRPGCHTWLNHFRPGKATTWSGACSGGVAVGRGRPRLHRLPQVQRWDGIAGPGQEARPVGLPLHQRECLRRVLRRWRCARPLGPPLRARRRTGSQSRPRQAGRPVGASLRRGRPARRQLPHRHRQGRTRRVGDSGRQTPSGQMDQQLLPRRQREGVAVERQQDAGAMPFGMTGKGRFMDFLSIDTGDTVAPRAPMPLGLPAQECANRLYGRETCSESAPR